MVLNWLLYAIVIILLEFELVITTIFKEWNSHQSVFIHYIKEWNLLMK